MPTMMIEKWAQETRNCSGNNITVSIYRLPAQDTMSTTTHTAPEPTATTPATVIHARAGGGASMTPMGVASTTDDARADVRPGWCRRTRGRTGRGRGLRGSNGRGHGGRGQITRSVDTPTPTMAQARARTHANGARQTTNMQHDDRPTSAAARSTKSPARMNTPMPVNTSTTTDHRRLITGEHEMAPPTPRAHKQTGGWTLSTEVRPSQITGAGNGLYTKEKAVKGDRVARYYGELIDAAEANKRKEAGAQYIVRVNSQQFLDAEHFPAQRGRYANDGGVRNNAKIATKLNQCPITKAYWVSIIAKRTIQPEHEVYVSYGRSFARAWKRTPNAAMAARPAETREPTPDDAHMQAIIMNIILGIVSMPRRAQRRVTALWNSAVHWASKGNCHKKEKACSNITNFIMQHAEKGTVTIL